MSDDNKPKTKDTITVVAATTFVQALTSFAALTPSAISPKLGNALGVETALIGLQISLVYAAAMISALYGGMPIKRFGACRTSQAALVFCGAGALLATYPALWAMALASLSIGTGYGLTNPAASHLLSKVAAPKARNLIFSIKQTGVPLGGIMAGTIAPPIAQHYSWPWAFACVAGFALTLAVILQKPREDWDSDRDPHAQFKETPLAGLGQVWAAPKLRDLSLAALFLAAIQLCVTSFMVAMLVEQLGRSLVLAGSILAAVQVGGFLGRLFWGALADRMGNGIKCLILLVAVTGASALATALLSASWETWLLAVPLVLFGFSAIGWNGVFLAEVAHNAAPGQVSRVTGGALFFTFAGVMLGPPIFAGVYRLTGDYALTYGLLAPVAGLGMFLLIRARRNSHPRP